MIIKNISISVKIFPLILFLLLSAYPETLFSQETPEADFFLAQRERTPPKPATLMNRFNPFSRDKKPSADNSRKQAPPANSRPAGQDSWAPVGSRSSEIPAEPYPSPALTTSAPDPSLSPEHLSSPVNPDGNSAEDSEPIIPNLHPVEKKEFQLPFEDMITSQNINTLREVRLYASRDYGKTWNLYWKLPPAEFRVREKQAFNVRVANDGEYWFLVALVDARGQETPRQKEIPTWRMLVNTSGKPLDPNMLKSENSVTKTDSSASKNLSNHSVQEIGVNADGKQTAAASPPAPAVERPKWSPDTSSGPVIASPVGTGTPSGAGAASGSYRDSVMFSVSEMNSAHASSEKLLPVYRVPKAEPVERIAAKPTISKKIASEETASGGLSAPTFVPFPELAADEAISSGISATETSHILQSENEIDALPETEPSPALTSADMFSEDFLASLEGPMNSARSHQSAVQYTNNPRLEIEYDVSNIGTSGVGRVELWGTLDGGQTWNFLTEDADRVSPVQVVLKTEGDYGLRIVVLNGAGVGGERPTAGTGAQMQVTYDRTSPQLVIQGVRLLADFGELEIRWDAHDPNFGSQCVILSWSETLEGKWTAMTPQALANNGIYTWRIPANLPGKIFVRVDAVDLAGNATTLVTGPVITDLSRPTATIINAKPAP